MKPAKTTTLQAEYLAARLQRWQALDRNDDRARAVHAKRMDDAYSHLMETGREGAALEAEALWNVMHARLAGRLR